MVRERVVDVLRGGGLLVADGAWGTQLQARGLRPGECPEAWCLDRPDEVRAVAAAYAAAGADLMETNSFGGTRFKLGHFGLADRVESLGEAAARLAREVAGPHRWVLGSVGPTGRLLLLGDVTETEMETAFAEQVRGLLRGGADVICVETMTDPAEATLAIRAARAEGAREIACTFTFDRTVQGDFRTIMGVSPAEAAEAALSAGADIVGSNCGNGIDAMVGIVEAMRSSVGDAPVLIQANAGLPRSENGRDVYPDGPDDMAARLEALVLAGARIVGGCCGTTPEHIRALRRAADALSASRPDSAPDATR